MADPSDPTATFLPTEREEATEWLNTLINKNLRVSVTDGRMFWGQFKCVDAESNIILQSCYEYRFPTPSQIAAAAAAVVNQQQQPPSSSTTITSGSALQAPSDPSTVPTPETTNPSSADLEQAYDKAAAAGKLKMDLSSRSLGLVVIPGQYITKIELEEFASQVRARNNKKQGFHPGWRDGGSGAPHAAVGGNWAIS
ncbi:hypothetical protein B0T20DRAFT_481553 [Sordaria brevicollis]|uniref:Sm domain-containing protein n=1 Tax=Sordaria brevicollis TaxID=83679 RepID=A0AAE0PB50_SORBR|nr:hypothetical protein B0T20DRAFT_481553 [Sordaria brevicollis]